MDIHKELTCFKESIEDTIISYFNSMDNLMFNTRIESAWEKTIQPSSLLVSANEKGYVIVEVVWTSTIIRISKDTLSGIIKALTSFEKKLCKQYPDRNFTKYLAIYDGLDLPKIIINKIKKNNIHLLKIDKKGNVV